MSLHSRYEHPSAIRAYLGMWILVAFAVGVAVYASRDLPLLSPAIIVLAVIVVVLLADIVRSMQAMARFVTVHPDKIAGTTFLGKSTELQWLEVSIVEDFQLPVFGAMRRIRLISDDKERRIMFSDGIDRFEDLLASIREMAPHARYGSRPPWWKRILVGY